MQKNDTIISRYQMLSLGFLGLLSPMIRLLPQQVVEKSGPYAWLAVLLTTVPVALLFLLIFRFLKYAMPNEGLGELFIRVLGKPLGKLAILLFTLWLLFYVAFAVRSAADRYITSAYNNTRPAVFILIMLGLCLVPLLGRFKNLGRTAESLLPLLALVLLLIFAFSFKEVDLTFLPPVTVSRLPTVLSGIPLVANVLSLAVYMGFLEGRISQKKSRARIAFIWLLIMLAVAVLLCVITVGHFGSKLTAGLNYPFFLMIRNISVFNFLERLDAVVLGLWVITDFALVSTMLFIIFNNLCLVFGYDPATAEIQKCLCLKKGRWLIWLCFALLIPVSLLIAPNAESLLWLSHYFVPMANNAFTFGLLPLIIIIGLLRKRV